MIVVFVLLGALATILFVAGYIRGVRIALATYADDEIETDDSGDIQTYWWGIAAAVFGAAVIIALAGVNPVFIYAGPLLALMTAAGIGVAFFFDKGRTPSS